MKNISDSAIDTIVCNFAKAPSPNSYLIFVQLGGAIKQISYDSTAYTHRDALFDLIIGSACLNNLTSFDHIDWTQRFSDAMQPFSTGGVYVNDLGNEGEARIKAAYGLNYKKLAILKKQYDPSNLFRLNQNIPPNR